MKMRSFAYEAVPFREEMTKQKKLNPGTIGYRCAIIRLKLSNRRPRIHFLFPQKASLNYDYSILTQASWNELKSAAKSFTNETTSFFCGTERTGFGSFLKSRSISNWGISWKWLAFLI